MCYLAYSWQRVFKLAFGGGYAKRKVGHVMAEAGHVIEGRSCDGRTSQLNFRM